MGTSCPGAPERARLKFSSTSPRTTCPSARSAGWRRSPSVSRPGMLMITHVNRFLDTWITRRLAIDYEAVAGYTGDHTRFLELKAVELRWPRKRATCPGDKLGRHGDQLRTRDRSDAVCSPRIGRSEASEPRPRSDCVTLWPSECPIYCSGCTLSAIRWLSTTQTRGIWSNRPNRLRTQLSFILEGNPLPERHRHWLPNWYSARC